MKSKKIVLALFWTLYNTTYDPSSVFQYICIYPAIHQPLNNAPICVSVCLSFCVLCNGASFSMYVYECTDSARVSARPVQNSFKKSLALKQQSAAVLLTKAH